MRNTAGAGRAVGRLPAGLRAGTVRARLFRLGARPSSLRPGALHRPPSIAARGRVRFALLLLATAAALLPVAAAPAAEAPSTYGRDYASRSLSTVELTALLWNACPEKPSTLCLVDDPRTEKGEVYLAAPPEVHREVSRRLARLDGARTTREIRIDLVRVDRQGALQLPPLLPGAPRRTLEAYRAQLSGAGLVHVGTWEVATDGSATGYLAAGETSFRVDLSLRERGVATPPAGPAAARGDGDGRPPAVAMELALQTVGEVPDGGFSGRLFQTSLAVAPGESRIAGTTRVRAGGEPYLVVVTVDR